MKCPICQAELSIQLESPLSEFIYYQCDQTVSYCHPAAEEPQRFEHYECVAHSSTHNRIQEIFYLDRIYIKITRFHNGAFIQGIEIMSVETDMNLEYIMRGPDIVGEVDVTDVSLEPLLHLDDPTILDNKTIDEMLKKIKLYLTLS